MKTKGRKKVSYRSSLRQQRIEEVGSELISMLSSGGQKWFTWVLVSCTSIGVSEISSLT